MSTRTNWITKAWNSIHPEPVPAFDAGRASPTTAKTQSEAHEALTRASSDLQKARARTPDVVEVTGKMSSQYERNHFAEMLEQSMLRKAS